MTGMGDVHLHGTYVSYDEDDVNNDHVLLLELFLVRG